jgi:hypothetical protein
MYSIKQASAFFREEVSPFFYEMRIADPTKKSFAVSEAAAL